MSGQDDPFIEGKIKFGGEAAKSVADISTQIQRDADRGDAKAQKDLALLYLRGEGVSKSIEKALEWLHKAAEQGLPEAQNNLGVLYNNIDDIKDLSKSEYWYLKAASQGFYGAQHNLAVFYEFDKINYEKAAEYYQMAAIQGHPESQYNLGVLFLNGSGVPEDKKEAKKWFEMAAEQGNEEAKSALERMEEDAASWILKQFIQLANENPLVATRKSELRRKYEFTDDEFNMLFTSYTFSLKSSGENANWNDDIEEYSSNAGISSEQIKQAKSDFTEAVLQRIETRFYMEKNK